MVEDSPGVDEVEGGVREGEVLGVGGAGVRREAKELEPVPGVVDRALGEVDAGQGPRLGPRPLQVIGPHPDADLEHVLRLRLVKAGEVAEVGLQPVALAPAP